MKKILITFVVFIIFSTNSIAVFAEQPKIDDGAYILIDQKTGEVLCQKNPEQKVYPASTTKIMTAILALQMGNLDQVMTASQAAVDDIGKDGSNIGIMAGEKITLENLLKALLICSANETANIIAENLCPTRQDFVDLMNEKARELGAVHTHFANPCGSHDPNHYTTPGDMAIFARYAMNIPEFRKIVCMKSFQMPPTNKHDSWPVLYTTNRLMQTYKSDLYGINGVKTGYTGPAGFNLVTSAVNGDGMDLIAVVMDIKNDGAKENVKTYSRELLDYGFKNYKLVTLQNGGSLYGSSIYVKNADDTAPLNLITKSDVKYVLPDDPSEWNIEVVPHIDNNITAPVEKGDVLGYIDYLRDGASIGRTDLTAQRAVQAKPLPVKPAGIKNLWGNIAVRIVAIAVSVLVFLVILRLVLRFILKRVLKKKNLRNISRF